MAIIFQDKEIKGLDESVSGVASGEIDLMITQRSRQQAQIHDSRWLRKIEIVSLGEALVSVRTFHELITEARSPLAIP